MEYYEIYLILQNRWKNRVEHLNLLQRIEKKSSEFSKGQRRLAQYITENYDIAAYLTASKLGKEAGVSESTVVRFAYQLDYEGYPELQKAIQVIVKTNSNSIQRMSLSSKRYQEKGVLKSILYTDSERLRDTIQSGVDEEEFNRSVMLINDARRLYILGARSARNRLLPKNFSSRVVAFKKRAGIIWSVSTFSKGRGTQVLVMILNFCFIVFAFLN